MGEMPNITAPATAAEATLDVIAYLLANYEPTILVTSIIVAIAAAMWIVERLLYYMYLLTRFMGFNRTTKVAEPVVFRRKGSDCIGFVIDDVDSYMAAAMKSSVENDLAYPDKPMLPKELISSIGSQAEKQKWLDAWLKYEEAYKKVEDSNKVREAEKELTVLRSTMRKPLRSLLCCSCFPWVKKEKKRERELAVIIGEVKMSDEERLVM